MNAQNTNQISLVANPVTTSNEVYDAYLEFLGLPGSLQETSQPPPPCAAHVVKRCGHKYYWVPVEYRTQFLRLSLLTTAQRGQSLLAPDEFFSVTLTDITNDRRGQSKKARLLTVKIDKKIPNDTGSLKFSVSDGKEIEFNVLRYADDKGNEPSMTDVITVVFFNDKIPDVTTAKQFKEKLFPLSAKIILDHKQPKAPSTDDLLQRANIQLQQIQFNQVRLGG